MAEKRGRCPATRHAMEVRPDCPCRLLGWVAIWVPWPRPAMPEGRPGFCQRCRPSTRAPFQGRPFEPVGSSDHHCARAPTGEARPDCRLDGPATTAGSKARRFVARSPAMKAAKSGCYFAHFLATKAGPKDYRFVHRLAKTAATSGRHFAHSPAMRAERRGCRFCRSPATKATRHANSQPGSCRMRGYAMRPWYQLCPARLRSPRQKPTSPQKENESTSSEIHLDRSSYMIRA